MPSPLAAGKRYRRTMILRGGYVLLHRRIREHRFWRDADALRACLHLLMAASWRPEEVRGVRLERGQVLISTRNLAAELGLSCPAPIG